MQQIKRRGDRKDGTLLRKLDSLHFITGIIYPNRCDNEAYISEKVDLTNINRYLSEINKDEDVFKYTIFHIIVTAMVKTITLRPKLNRFIANENFYQRNEITAAFIVKKLFSDDAPEGLAFLHANEDSTLMSLHKDLYKQISSARSDDETNSTDDSMEILNKLPRVISKTAIHFFCWLDKHGWVPKSMIACDPYYASVLLSNVGSIKLGSGYHHLTNWGTCSLFCLIGEKKFRPFFNDDGSFEMRDSLELGLTIDERLADGYYYSKSVKLLRYLLENPELLEKPINQEVDYE